MKYEITIVADPNDGDYMTRVEEISEEDLETIKPLIQAIKEFKPYTVEYENKYSVGAGLRKTTHSNNYPFGDCLRKDMGEKSPEEIYSFSKEVFYIFEDLIPCSEYGIHTIESVTVCPLQKKTKLL